MLRVRSCTRMAITVGCRACTATRGADCSLQRPASLFFGPSRLLRQAPGEWRRITTGILADKPLAQQAGRRGWQQQQRRSSRNSTGGGGTGGSGRGGGGGGGGDGFGAEPHRSGGLFGIWAAYLRLLDTQPVLTKALTSALLNGLGDAFSQKYVEKKSAVDWRRCSIFSLLGLVLVGPALHYWYLTLSKIVTATGNTGALLRLGLDQFVFAPAFIAVFFAALLSLEGHPGDVQAKLKQDWMDAVKTNWKIWIPFQFINFRFIPQNLQVLMANFVALGWNTYLSFASHIAVEAPPL